MSALDSALDLLLCPICQSRQAGTVRLARRERSLVCEHGHSFDIARQGYVNLTNGAPPDNADTAPMLGARQRFLGSGVYEPIRAAIVRACGPAHTLLEVGAGTGWYLQGVLDARPGTIGLASDVSVVAAKHAARSGLASVVADTWAGLPVRSASIDTLMCIFAPRRADEFARLLSPTGHAVIAWPTPRHLASLRDKLGLLDVAADKGEQLAAQFLDAELQHTGHELVEFSTVCTAEQISDLVAMGPNAFHSHSAPDEGADIDVSVEVSVFSHGKQE